MPIGPRAGSTAGPFFEANRAGGELRRWFHGAARGIGAAVGGGLHEGLEVWTFDLARSALARQDADVVAALKAYRSEHVVTLGEVDDVHQRPRGTARVTFNRNRSRSEEARHFFLLPLGAGRR